MATTIEGRTRPSERRGAPRRPLFFYASEMVRKPNAQPRSTHIAIPIPPPMQSVASPFFAPRRRIS